MVVSGGLYCNVRFAGYHREFRLAVPWDSQTSPLCSGFVSFEIENLMLIPALTDQFRVLA